MERKTVQVRHEEILEATVRQIQQVGIDSLRIAGVARDLGVSPALVIYHFKTKENLVAEAFRYASEVDLARMTAIVRSSGTPVDRLMEVLRWYAPTGRARGWLLWIDGWSSALRDDVLAGVIKELDRRWKQAVGDVIAEGVRTGDFTVADPMAAAVRITAMLDGLAVNSIVNGGDRSVVDEWMVQLVSWELGVAPAAFAAPARSAAARVRRASRASTSN
jgi:AcrR family transcriptional regulator